MEETRIPEEDMEKIRFPEEDMAVLHIIIDKTKFVVVI